MVSSYQGTASAISRVNSPTNIHCDSAAYFSVFQLLRTCFLGLNRMTGSVTLKIVSFSYFSLKYDYVRQKSNKEKNRELYHLHSSLQPVPCPSTSLQIHILFSIIFVLYIHIHGSIYIYIMYSCVSITS